MKNEDVRKKSIKDMKVRSSGHAWIPKNTFYSSEKVLSIIEKCKKVLVK